MAKTREKHQTKEKKHHHHHHHQLPKKQEKPHSWAAVRSLFTCKYLQIQPPPPPPPQQQQESPSSSQKQKSQQQKQKQKLKQEEALPNSEQKIKKQGKTEQITTLEEMDNNNNKNKKMKCYYYSGSSLCNNTKVVHRPEGSPPEEPQKKKGVILMGSSSNLSEVNGVVSNSSSCSSNSPSISGSFRNMPFRKLSGCYECRMVVDPVLGSTTRDPSSLRACCAQCGEVFSKAESLELHQSVRHAVSELGPEDTSKNIVEIIFQSSWLKKQAPVCKIDRILKVQNTPKTIAKFEEYRDTIKTKATRLPKKHPRCLADGNELLRFHCTTLRCSLGLNGSSNLCNSIPSCSVCSIIKNGFKATSEVSPKGILTTATSGKAHDNAMVALDDGKRAMLVCRVIAGRVKKNPDGSTEDYDSVAGAVGVYSNLDELYVFSPKAILPCFVVIYRGF